MADDCATRKPKREETKKRNVPIAVTHEGFWCCPSHATFQKTATVQKKHSFPLEKKKALPVQPKSESFPFDNGKVGFCAPGVGTEEVDSSARKRTVDEMAKKKVTVEFGDVDARDFRVILHGRHGYVVDLHLQKSVIVEKSSFFGDKLRDEEEEKNVGVSFMHVHDCNDVETYVEIIGLMYSMEMKPVLIKHGVPKALRLLKVAEQLGFSSCVQSCLEYLEAVPWGGRKEEETVVATLLQLRVGRGGVSPVLRRISCDTSPPTEEMLSHILDLVLGSRDEQARTDMKFVVLKLLTESNISTSTITTACGGSLKSLRLLFVEAAGGSSAELKPRREPPGKLISLETDNLLWLLEMLVERAEGEGFAAEWAGAEELAGLYGMVPAATRHHVGRITARLFVCLGKGEVVASEETRRMLVRTWLRPLMEDYRWVHRQRRCEREVVEKEIGKTILTLPLEDQREAFLDWLGCFLKVGGGGGGEGCPNLQWAFRVWWRRAFSRPYADVF